MSQTFEFNSHRSPVYGRGGMVAASQPLAVAAGLEILRIGGTAADAAVAVAAALNVTEPCSTGLGGDAFMLYFDSASHKVSALNGSGRAPAALTLERLQQEGFGGQLPPFHAYTITVPGACAAWCDTVERFGCLSMNDILAPAVRLAEEGFPVAPLTAHHWRNGVRDQLAHSLNGHELTIDGHAPHVGQIFHNPGLARALRLIAKGGKKAFYEGPTAESIAAVVQQAGGCLMQTDLAAHTSSWVEPVSVPYRGVRVWECPPNGQGLAALLALRLLDGFDLPSLAPLSIDRLHLEIEAMRLAFADARQYVADPDFASAPLEALLSEEYAAWRRELIDPLHALAEVHYGLQHRSGSDTVYFSVVDARGNACSFINSNYAGFGTGIVPAGWGFSLQNRGANFSLDPQHPNALAPGKRPYHTIIPAMATNESDGSLYACFGVMGGFMQPQGHVQVLSAMLDDQLDPQAALDRPRFCVDGANGSGEVALEVGIPPRVVEELGRMGHPVRMVGGLERSLFGRGQIIRREVSSGVLIAGSDPRSDGCAMTLI